MREGVDEGMDAVDVGATSVDDARAVVIGSERRGMLTRRRKPPKTALSNDM